MGVRDGSALAALRMRIAQIEGRSRRGGSVLPFGIRAVDARLPGGGLALGALHEVAGGGNGAIDGAAAALFAPSGENEQSVRSNPNRVYGANRTSRTVA